MLGIGLPTLIAEIASFLIFLFLLSRLPFALPLIRRTLAERQQRIGETIEAAAKDRQQAEALRGELEAELKASREQGQRLLEEARKAASSQSQELLTQARQQSERLIQTARQEIQAEKDAALRDVSSQVAELALAATEKLLRHKLDQAEQHRLVEHLLHGGKDQ
jgi:F-type H+-transporting ATPase subunit b